MTWSIGNIAGPALGGFLLGAENATELFVLLSGACLVAAFYALRLGRIIPGETDTFAPSVVTPAA